MIGAGGHAKVLLDLLEVCGAKIVDIVDSNPENNGGDLLGFPVVSGDQNVLSHQSAAIDLVLGVGSTSPSTKRKEIFIRFSNIGYKFRTCIHPSAVVSAHAALGAGAQVMAGAVIQADCRIGNNTIVNTGATVDHDCQIGDHVHIAPGAILSGAVNVGDGAHIGAGAIIRECITVGAWAMVAAGACVIHDVPEFGRVAGIPARELTHG